MAKCNRCGTDTQLYDNGNPICLDCVAEQEKRQQERKPPAREPGETYESKRQAG